MVTIPIYDVIPRHVQVVELLFVAVHYAREGQETKTAEDCRHEMGVEHECGHLWGTSKEQFMSFTKYGDEQHNDGRNAVNTHVESAIEPKQQHHFGRQTDGEHRAREEQRQRNREVSQAQAQQYGLLQAVALLLIS